MKIIAIICGGYSGEYEISVESAKTVENNIDKSKFKSYIIFIEHDRWYYHDKSGSITLINRNDFTLTLDNEIIKFDGVFNVIHGTPGEDGKIEAYFDMLNIPYTSCSQDTSALTFNKFHCNLLLKSLGVKVANSLSFLKGENIDKQKIIKALGLPLFIKPARSGSSVGVSKVYSINDFDYAINTAFDIDNRIIFEEFINGKELGCGVFMDNNMLKVLPLTEIISKKDFFDYEAKYSGNMSDEITPAEHLSTEQEIDIKTLSAMIYKKLECKGIIRIDYILTDTVLYLIEINTIPGLSPKSIIPQQAAAMGISLKELFTVVIEAMF